MTKAFVTGGTGFIGSSVVRSLLRRGVDVRALCRPGSQRANLDGLNIEPIEGDLRDPESLKRGMKGCDLVFHVGALYSFWVRPPRLIYEVNVDGTRNMLQAAQQTGVRRFVHTSSVATVGHGDKRRPADETAETSLEDVEGDYKKSKYLAEQVANEYTNRVPVVIVNPSFPVGPRDVKPTPTGQTILDFLNRRMPAYIDTGMNVVDVDDVAEGHWLAAEKGRVGQRYILGGENLSMRELLKLLSEMTGMPAPRLCVPHSVVLPLSYINAAFCRVFPRCTPRMTPDTVRMSRHYMYFDSTKAIQELGLPQTPTRSALSKAVNWFRSNGYVRSQNGAVSTLDR